MFVAMAAISFASCGEGAGETAACDSDSVQDTVCCDTVAADTVAADTVVAE